MKRFKKSISLCLLLILLPTFAIQAFAATDPITPIDTGKETKLTLQYSYGTIPLHDVTFSMYHVADMSKSGSFIRMKEPFKSVYDPANSWDVVAKKMKNAAIQGNEEPKRTGKTDSDGVLTFQSTPEDKLSTGLYLIVGDSVTVTDEGPLKGETFTTAPFLISLPTFVGENHNGTDEVWNYDKVVVSPKASGNILYTVIYDENKEKLDDNTEVTNMPDTDTFGIDSERLKYRAQPLVTYVPKGVSGESKNSYDLSIENGGPKADGYTFMGWNENKDADEGYSTLAFSSITRNYKVYAIWQKNSPTPDNPTSSTQPTDPGNPDDPDNKGSDPQKKDPVLAQTGMLWWPVPVLALIGFAVFMVGAFKDKKKSAKRKNANNGILLITGILFISSAVCLVLYNTWDDWRAGADMASERNMVVHFLPDPDDDAGETSRSKKSEETNVTDMPVKTIQGTDYAAMLSIPSLSLELPVRNEWSYPGLRRSPCRYTGSAYTDDLVICGHNYSTHFGNLKKLAKGDEVIVAAMNGDIFHYEVEEITLLSPSSYREMVASQYDLTLFTCNASGRQRLTVRCRLVNFRRHAQGQIATEFVLF